MKKLKVTSSKPYSMFNFESEKISLFPLDGYPGIEDVPENISASFYLHGELQGIAGFDIPIFLEGTYPKIDGIYDCSFLMLDENKNIKEIECKFYKWNSLSRDRELGLIVMNGDESGDNDANEKYVQKVSHL